MDMLMLLGNNGLKFAVLDVSNSESLENTRVGVFEES
jgi:hypothetical protein